MVKYFLRQSPFGLLLVTFAIYGLCILLLTPLGGHEVVNYKSDLIVTTKNNGYKIGDIVVLQDVKKKVSFVQIINAKESMTGILYEVQNYLEKEPKKYLIPSKNISGKAFYTIKQGGLFLNFSQTTQGLIFFTGIPIMFIIFELALRELGKMPRRIRSKRVAAKAGKKAYQPMGVNYPSASFQSLINTFSSNSSKVISRLTSSYKLSHN